MSHSIIDAAGEPSSQGSPAKPSNASPKLSRAHWSLLAIILAATFLVYARTLNFQFVYDDHPWLVENPALHSWRYIGDYFTKHLWAGVGPYVVGNYYRPVFMLWSRTLTWIFGSNPVGYHLGSVSLHVMVTLLVFLLALTISSNRNHAALAAMIFGLHPVHVESVAWILGDTDSLAGVFLISSFLCWNAGKNFSPASKRWRVTSWALFAFGLLAKEVTLVLPLLIIAHDYFSADEVVKAGVWGARLKKLRGSVWEAMPFVAIVLPYLVLRIRVLHGFSHPVVKALPWQLIPAAWPELIWLYLRHLMWPVGLTIYYDLPSTFPLGFENFLLPLVGSVGATLLLVCGAAKSKVIRLSAVWFLIPLVPAFDLRLFSRDDLAHDRFLYLPSIGFALIMAHLITILPAGKLRIYGHSLAKTLLILVLAMGMFITTTIESSYFRDDWHFLNHVWSAAPRNLYATLALGRYWRSRGHYAESAKLMEACVRDHPDDWDATYSLGRDYYKLGRFREAISAFIRASLLDPSAPGPYLDLGLSWMQLGQHDRAEAAFREAVKLKPDGYGYHFALGMALMKEGKQAEALEQFKTEMRYFPDNSAAKAEIGEITADENPKAPRP